MVDEPISRCKWPDASFAATSKSVLPLLFRDRRGTGQIGDRHAWIHSMGYTEGIVCWAHHSGTAAMSELMIEVRNLNRTFGNVHAVRDVSFSIQAGKVVGFIGANGAG